MTDLQGNAGTFPYQYKRVDPERVAEAAYRGYYRSGCAYGVFTGLVSTVAGGSENLELGRFPYVLAAFGNGGLGGNRSLCGAVNGAAMAIAMFHGEEDDEAPGSVIRDSLISELIAWFQGNSLPQFQPSQELISELESHAGDIQTCVIDSLLCDEICTSWQNATGFVRDSPERREHCARLTADVAAKVAELLNDMV